MMEPRILCLKERMDELYDENEPIMATGCNLLKEIVSISGTCQQKQDIFNNLLMTDLLKVEIKSRCLRDTNGSAASETSEEIDARLHEVTSQLLELTNSQIPITLESYYQSFLTQRNELSELSAMVDTEYAEISKLQNMLRVAADEEAKAKQRLNTDLPTLQATALRINSELEYIKKERDMLKLRLASDFPSMPMEELLAAQQITHNEEWKQLLSNAWYSQLSYN